MKNVKIRLPEARLVSVFQNNDPLLADMVRDRLEENGISAVTEGENQAGFTGALPVKVVVLESQADAAAAIIKELFPSQT